MTIMRRLFRFSIIACSLLLNACATHTAPPPPPPPPPVPVSVTLAWDDAPITLSNFNAYADGTLCQAVVSDARQATCTVLPGSHTYCVEAVALSGQVSPRACITSSGVAVSLGTVPAFPFPPVPGRTTKLSFQLQFQGMMCHTDQYGDLPWFEAALFSLTPTDRQHIYACKHAAGDTHAIIALGANPFDSVYDEPGQPYQQMHYVGFQTNLSAFVSAVQEVITNGFTPFIFLGGDGPNGYPIASQQFPVLSNALRTAFAIDLNQYVVWVPGWDSVFFGWAPADITQFGAQVKSLCPQCLLAIEFNIGHIPLGSGPSDYTQAGGANGSMWNYDLLLAEFNNGDIHNDATWQVLGRLLGPNYRRPSDQPSGDDPNPPFYLAGWQGLVACFEWSEYGWVRQQTTAVVVQADANYLRSLGCAVVD
jgi:hypothetical protein